MPTTTANIQTVIQAAFSAQSWFDDADIPILLEDQPDTPEAFENYMASPGACVIVGKPNFARIENGRVQINVSVEIYENTKINRAVGGTLKECDEISENAWAAMEEYQHATYPQFAPLLPQSLDFDMTNLGELVGIITIQTTSGIKVTSY